MELNELEKVRVEKINKMRAENIEPYPTRNEVQMQIGEALQNLPISNLLIKTKNSKKNLH